MEKSFRFCYPLMYPIPEFNSKSFHNLTESGKQREVTVVAKGEGAGRGLDWELAGSENVNYSIQDGQTTRSSCTAQAVCSTSCDKPNGKEGGRLINIY